MFGGYCCSTETPSMLKKVKRMSDSCRIVFGISLLSLIGNHSLQGVYKNVDRLNVFTADGTLFQPIPINSFHHGPNEHRECSPHLLNFLIERIPSKVIVEVSNQVNQTFLVGDN